MAACDKYKVCCVKSHASCLIIVAPAICCTFVLYLASSVHIDGLSMMASHTMSHPTNYYEQAQIEAPWLQSSIEMMVQVPQQWLQRLLSLSHACTDTQGQQLKLAGHHGECS